MRAIVVVVVDELVQDRAQVVLAEGYQVVEALAALMEESGQGGEEDAEQFKHRRRVADRMRVDASRDYLA